MTNSQQTQCALVALCLVVLSSGCGGGSESRPLTQAHDASPSEALTAPQSKALVPITGDPISLSEFVKVAERRISRTVFEYDFKLRLTNNRNARLTTINSTITSVGLGTSIVDAKAFAAGLDALGETLTDDVITIRQDRQLTFDPSAVQVTFSYKPVLNPFANLDRSENLVGADADQDGVRDDIAQMIHGLGLPLKVRERVVRHAKNIQAAIINPTSPKSHAQLAMSAACLHAVANDASHIAVLLRSVTANTRMRYGALREFDKAAPPSAKLEICQLEGGAA